MSIHLSTTPTRKVLLQQLEELLGPLNPDVAAEWITKYLLQRRDAELLELERRNPSMHDSTEGDQTDLAGPPSPSPSPPLPMNGHGKINGTDAVDPKPATKKRKRDAATVDTDKPAASPLAPSLNAHHGLEEIDIDESAPASVLPRPLAKPSPPSTLHLLSVLTFLLPSRDAAFYASWSADALTQRIASAYHSELSALQSTAPSPLSADWLFTLAHLLSPVLLTGKEVTWVDAEVKALVRDLAAKVREGIEADDLDDGDGVDEARMALSHVLRASKAVGLEDVDELWMREWVASISPEPTPSPAVPSTEDVRPTSPAVSESSDAESSEPSPAAAVEARVTIASVTHMSLQKAVLAVKPRFIVLDAANIGRWSGSGDPSTEVTVNTNGHSSLPSHLQSLPTSLPSTRNMVRLDSWQIAAAVLAVESTLRTPALCCLPEQFIRRPERFGVRDHELLLLLQRQGKLHRLPAGADDDTQLIALANDAETWLVTNDNLRDHVYGGTVSRDWVGSRLIKFYTVLYPSVGGDGDAEGKELRTMEEVKQRGTVCLVEPAAMRKNIGHHHKEAADTDKAGDEDSAVVKGGHPAVGYPQGMPGYGAYGGWLPYGWYGPPAPPPPPPYGLGYGEYGGGWAGYDGSAPSATTQYPLIVPPSLRAEYASSPYTLYEPPKPYSSAPPTPSARAENGAERYGASSSASSPSSAIAARSAGYPPGAFIPPNAPPPIIVGRR